MKKTLFFALSPLFLLFSCAPKTSPSSSSNPSSTVETEKPKDLYEALNLLIDSSIPYTMDFEDDYPFTYTGSDGQTQQFDGVRTSLTYTGKALEKELFSLDGQPLTHYGYAAVQGGVMEYDFDEEGQFQKGKIADTGATLQDSTRIDIHPFRLSKNNDKLSGLDSYDFDFKREFDVDVVSAFLSANDFSYSALSSYISNANISLETDGTLRFALETQDSSSGSANSMTAIANSGRSIALPEVQSFLESDGAPVPFDERLVKLGEDASKSQVIHFQLTSQTATDTLYFNKDYETPYAYVDFANNFDAKDSLFIPILNKSGTPDNIYQVPFDENGFAGGTTPLSDMAVFQKDTVDSSNALSNLEKALAEYINITSLDYYTFSTHLEDFTDGTETETGYGTFFEIKKSPSLSEFSSIYRKIFPDSDTDVYYAGIGFENSTIHFVEFLEQSLDENTQRYEATVTDIGNVEKVTMKNAETWIESL